jgi:hypothetical protein
VVEKKEREKVSANVRVTTLSCYHPCWKFRCSIKLPESLHHRILLVSAGTSDAAYIERAKNTTSWFATQMHISFKSLLKK